jgi:hypothetical protein
MKFFREISRICFEIIFYSWLGLFFISCSTEKSPSTKIKTEDSTISSHEELTRTSVETVFEKDKALNTSFDELEKLEMTNPHDPMIKLRLSRLTYCQNNFGETLNIFYWIMQFSENIELIEMAQTWADELKAKKKLTPAQVWKCF